MWLNRARGRCCFPASRREKQRLFLSPCPCRARTYAFQIHDPPSPARWDWAGGPAVGWDRVVLGAGQSPVPRPGRGFLQPGGSGTRFACVWLCLE